MKAAHRVFCAAEGAEMPEKRPTGTTLLKTPILAVLPPGKPGADAVELTGTKLRLPVSVVRAAVDEAGSSACGARCPFALELKHAVADGYRIGPGKHGPDS